MAKEEESTEQVEGIQTQSRLQGSYLLVIFSGEQVV